MIRLTPLRYLSGSVSLHGVRPYSTPAKASVKLIAEIRKQTTTSMTKAREALEATGNDLRAALEWLEKDLVETGAKKAAKLENRTAGEGLVAVSVLSEGGWISTGGKLRPAGVRAAIIELNCETDFVARNELFVKLAHDISHTAAFISEPSHSTTLLNDVPLDMLSDAPLISGLSPATAPSGTVASSIRDAVAKVGEKISLRRVRSIVTDPIKDPMFGLAISSYVHGSQSSTARSQAGKMAALVAVGLRSPSLPSLLPSGSFVQDFSKLTRSLSRQVAGLETLSITGRSLEVGDEDSTVLYEQPFVMLMDGSSSDSVAKVLQSWSIEKGLKAGQNGNDEGVQVVDFSKWAVGSS
ncbi:Elongation factor Ts, mitochondrial [Tulasnella sp. 418]|nr:Elongation factor Ts, mitochondrial [Tulasnella sp. 418]